jgi:hypothetical protein
VSVARNGYVQTATRTASGALMVRVATAVDPVESDESYAELRLRPRPSVPAGFSLPPDLTAELHDGLSAFAAATRVLDWVMTRVAHDVDDLAPQDAASVLRRRRGRCSGLANASTALLRAAGFEARTVSGLLVDGAGATPHRWLECHLGGAGWVPTDPTLGLWAVTPRHIVFSAAVADPPSIETVAIDDRGLDMLPRRGGRPFRPNRGAQLSCRLIGPAPGLPVLVVLSGPAGLTRRGVLDPEGHFTGLLPGRWQLQVERNGRCLKRHEFDLEEGSVHSLAIDI